MAATERIIQPSAVLGGGGTLIASPFQFAVTGEDNLRIRTWGIDYVNAQMARDCVLVTFRLVGPDAKIQLTARGFTPTNDRIATVGFISVGSGFVQDLTVTWNGPPTFSGLCYVTVDLVRGLNAGNATLAGQLIGGYIRPGGGQAWPGSPITSSVEGRGFPRVITPILFTIGSELQIVQPQLTRWRLQGASTLLNTDATAVNRLPGIAICDATHTVLMRCMSPSSVGPSTALRTVFQPGVSQVPAAGFATAVAPLPADLMRLGLQVLQTNTGLLQAGDQYTEWNLFVEEWLEANV